MRWAIAHVRSETHSSNHGTESFLVVLKLGFSYWTLIKTTDYSNENPILEEIDLHPGPRVVLHKGFNGLVLLEHTG